MCALRFAAAVVGQALVDAFGIFNPIKYPRLCFLFAMLVVGVLVGDFPAAMLLLVPVGMLVGLSVKIPEISQKQRKRASWHRLLQGGAVAAAAPAGPWTLAAPDSYALLRGPKVDGRWVLTLALLDLMARGVYDIRWWSGQAKDGPSTPLIVPVAALAKDLPDSLQMIVTVQTILARSGNGHPSVSELVTWLNWRYGDLDGCVTGEVLRTLATSGHYAIETHRLMGCWPRTRLVLTAKGAAARQDLETRLAWLLPRLQASQPRQLSKAAVDVGSSQPAVPGGVLEDPQRGLAVALVALAAGQQRPPVALSAIERGTTAATPPVDSHDVEDDGWMIEALARSRFWEAVAQLEHLEAVVIGSDGGDVDDDGDDGGE